MEPTSHWHHSSEKRIMPTYLYACNKCEGTFEVEQRITEEPLTDCRCGAKSSLRRLIQPTAVLFKGSGFHINDYASNSGSSPATPEPTGCDQPDCACKPPATDSS